MNHSDYLNPQTLKVQCRTVIKQLEEENISIKSLRKNINAFLHSNSAKGAAVNAAKNHLSEYLVVLNAQEQANNCDISDYKSLSRQIGSEVLDGDKILTLLEKKKRSMYRKLEMADIFRQADCFGSDVVSFGYRQIAGWYEISAEIDEQICKECEKKVEQFDDIVRNTNELFETSVYMREAVSVAVAGLMGAFVGGKYRGNSKASWKEDVKLASYGVTRPSGISDSDWKTYKKAAYDQISDMESDGWHKDSIKAYTKYINKNATGKNAVKKIQQYNKDTDRVGSDIFKDIWYAWETKGDETESRKKIKVLMNVVGMEELTGDSEQTKDILSHFDCDMAPHDPFWNNFAKTVQDGYPNGLKGLTGEENELAKKVHQFRYVIDAQQVQYIREKYKWIGGTDEDKLAAYARELNENGMGDDWKVESDRLHQKAKKVDGNYVYPDGSSGPNIKVTFNEGFHSEFILDSEGNFLYILNDTEDEGVKKNSIINGASFNYADKNDSTHKTLDIQYGSHDPQFRKDINPKIGEDEDGKTIKEYRAPDRAVLYWLINPTKDRKEEFMEKVNG